MYIDVKTDAYAGKPDKHKPVLKKIGKIAYEYADKAHKLNPEGKEAITFILQSYGYYVGSFGIFKAVLDGPAGLIKDFSHKLIEIDDKYHGCTGYQSLGRLYYEAPWPVGNLKKATKYYKKALETDPDIVLAHYWMGMIYMKRRRDTKAMKEFTHVLNNPPHEIETHIIHVYKKLAEKHLKKI